MGPLYEMWKEWAVDQWSWIGTGGRVWRIVATGLMTAPALYAIALAIEFLVWCGDCFQCRGYENDWLGSRTCLIPSIWSGDVFFGTFFFLSSAGILIGIIYAINVVAQDAKWKRKRKIEDEKREIQDKIREKQKELADLGDAQAQFALGQYYAKSRNINDLRRAKELLEKAAAQGYKDAILKDKVQSKIAAIEIEEHERQIQANKQAQTKKDSVVEKKPTKVTRGLCHSCLQIPYGNGMTLGQALERNPMISDYEISATIMGQACSSCWAKIQSRTSLGY